MKVVAVALLLLSIVAVALGSSHSEAPNTAKFPQADATDFYMFRSYGSDVSGSDTGFVTFLLNVEGLQSPYAGPNYYSLSDAHFYEIYIDNQGDAVEDLVFQWIYSTTFGGSNANVTVYPAEFDCQYHATSSITNGGITVPVQTTPTTQNVPIVFKFVSPITAGNNAGLNWFETYVLNMIKGNRDSLSIKSVTNAADNTAVFSMPFNNAGEKSFPDYETYADQYIYSVNFPYNCPAGNTAGKVFVGQRTESFFINLGAIFDLINLVPIPGFPGAISQTPLNNDLADKNINTFALEVPTACLTADQAETGIIGAWTAIRQLKHDSDGNHIPGAQVSRLGQPLINELVIGLRDKFQFNAQDPIDDVASFAQYVLYPTLPYIVNVLFGAAVNSVLGTNFSTIAPATPRYDLLFTVQGVPGLTQNGNITTPGYSGDMLRLNVGVDPVAQASQNTLGVIAGDNAGYPNGRRPGDDIVDITLQVVVAGKLCQLGVGCNSSTSPTVAPIAAVALTDGAPISAMDFQNVFPYLNYPLPGAYNAGHDLTTTTGGSPASSFSFPSIIAVSLALVAGFLISFGFFA